MTTQETAISADGDDGKEHGTDASLGPTQEHPSMDAQHHYRQQTVETASPARLISMLYHEGVATIIRSEEHLTAGRVEEAHHQLQRAQAIVNELRASLDFERGGIIARNLDSLYEFVLDRLITANVRKDPTGLKGARETLADLAVTWDEATASVGAPEPTSVAVVG